MCLQCSLTYLLTHKSTQFVKPENQEVKMKRSHQHHIHQHKGKKDIIIYTKIPIKNMIRNFVSRGARVWKGRRRLLSSTVCLDEKIVNYASSRNEKRVIRCLNKMEGVPNIETLFAVADMWKASGNSTMFHESIRSIAEHERSDRNRLKIVKYYGYLCRMCRNEPNSRKNRKQMLQTINEIVKFVSHDVHSKKVWSEICRSVDHAVAMFDHVRGKRENRSFHPVKSFDFEGTRDGIVLGKSCTFHGTKISLST